MFSSVFFQLMERKTMLCEQQKITVMQKLERLGDTDYIKKKKNVSPSSGVSGSQILQQFRKGKTTLDIMEFM